MYIILETKSMDANAFDKLTFLHNGKIGKFHKSLIQCLLDRMANSALMRSLKVCYTFSNTNSLRRNNQLVCHDRTNGKF